jgi:uncharacterized protein (DUF305 family)
MKAIMLAPALVLALAAAPALAQDTLPPICGVPEHAMNDMAGMDSMAADPPVDDAHAALMSGMDAMDSQMMQGMKAADIDVAFICGMIPHHQGAISMAKAELAHGDDPAARELALNIIKAQEGEIAWMLDWLSKQPQP